MKKTYTHTLTIAIAWVWVALFSGFSAKADPSTDLRLVLGMPRLEEAEVVLDLRVTGLFTEDMREVLESGLPATLSFEWELWRHRASWWDRRVLSGGLYYRIFYDVLEETYDLIDSKGRSIASCATIEEVEAVLCLDQVLELSGAIDLLATHRYYTGVEARLEALDEEELRKLEFWLQGDERGKGNEE